MSRKTIRPCGSFPRCGAVVSADMEQAVRSPEGKDFGFELNVEQAN